MNDELFKILNSAVRPGACGKTHSNNRELDEDEIDKMV